MDKSISKKIKDRIFHNVALKIISVMFAILMWLLVINIDDPQTSVLVTGIDVKILNESAILNNGDAYDVLSGSTISVKVTGPRTIVDSLKASDFRATADFQELSKTNAVPINVSLENAKYEAKLNITSKSENVMMLSIEELVDKEYDVQVEYQGTPASGYVVYSTSAENQKVKIKAPKSVHEKIAKVSAVVKLSGKENKKFDYEANVVVYNENGTVIDQQKKHITINNNVINVNTVVYYHKSVDIYYNTTETLEDGLFVSEYTASKKKVDIYGKKQTLDEISKLTIPDVLLKVDGSRDSIDIDLRNITPDGVFIKDEEAAFTLSIQIGEVSRKSFKVKISEIAIKKIPEGYESSIINTGEIELVVEGKEEDIKELTLEQLSPYIDLENASPGENYVEVNIIAIEGVSMAEPIEVTASLTEKVEETTSAKETKEEITKKDNKEKEEPEQETTKQKDKSDVQEEATKKTAD